MTARHYRTLESVELVWNGDHADPELRHDGVVLDYRTVEDTLWETALEDLDAPDLDDAAFDQWIAANRDRCLAILDDLADTVSGRADRCARIDEEGRTVYVVTGYTEGMVREEVVGVFTDLHRAQAALETWCTARPGAFPEFMDAVERRDFAEYVEANIDTCAVVFHEGVVDGSRVVVNKVELDAD